MNPLEEQTRRAAVYGLPPEGPVTDPPNVNLPAPREGVWSALSLYDFTPPARWFEMPGGGGVWVHALSEEEVAWLNLQAWREVRALRLPDGHEEEANELARTRAQVWQVILCCRQGEEPDSALVFRPEDAPALRRNRGWFQAVQNICRLSDSVGADEAVLLETMRDFFGELAAGLRSLSGSLSSADTATSCRKALADCGSLVSSIRRRGRLTRTDLSALRAFLEAAETTPTPTSSPSSDPGPNGPSPLARAPSDLEPAGAL